APDREIKSVDLHGNTRDAGIDVGADERAVTGQAFGFAIQDHVAVWHFAATLGRIHKQGRNAAVGVNAVVALGGTGAEGDRIELVFATVQVLGQLFELECTFMGGQVAQRLLAYGPSVVDHAGNIDAV